MSPAPSLIHQIVSGNLYDILKAYARKFGGFAGYSPIDVYLDQKNVFQPDLLYLSKENLGIKGEKGIDGAPDLAVEIISPSNGFKDRNQKKNLYQKFGVKEYWIIDPQTETIEQFLLKKDGQYFLHLKSGNGEISSMIIPGFQIPIRAVFDLETNRRTLAALLG